MTDLIGKKFDVLNDGYVALIDVMGDDSAIVDAARISYGKGTRRRSGDRDLIRYLMRNHHGTPFEMAEIKLAVRVPMDTWRQWIRHRTANVNEYSTRYSEAIDSMQATPEDGWRLQATDNKQGSESVVTEWPKGWGVSAMTNVPSCWDSPGKYLSRMESQFGELARELYAERLEFGVAREQARKDLPLSTYTEAFWKCDLRNVLGFLALRMDPHAQQEIRSYAEIIGREIVAKLFPLAWEAFEDYTLGAMPLSRLDIEVIKRLDGFTPPVTEDQFLSSVDWAKVGWDGERCRERDECWAKLVRLGLAKEEA